MILLIYKIKESLNSNYSQSLNPIHYQTTRESPQQSQLRIFQSLKLKFLMKIKISPQTNPKLLENFPFDPYSDITIRCKNSKYCLLLAYLSIDSAYFGVLHSGMDIDLSNLPQQQLTKVLRALYGAELEANSIHELESLYRVIKYLQIHQYQLQLAQQIVRRPDLLESIEILAFCLQNDFIKKQIVDYHLQNDLHVLTNSKNYLRINKLPSHSLNILLIKYYQAKGQKSDQTINHILENYLNRSKFGAIDYFQNSQNSQNQSLLPLIQIWEKHHHKLNIKSFVKYKSAGELNKQALFRPPTIQNLVSSRNLQLNHQASSQASSSNTDTAESISLSEALFTKIQQLKKNFSNSSQGSQAAYKGNGNYLSIPSPKNMTNTLYKNQKRSCIIQKNSQSQQSQTDQKMPKYGSGSQRIQKRSNMSVTFGVSVFKQNQQSKTKEDTLKPIIQNERTQFSASEQILSDLKKLMLKYKA